MIGKTISHYKILSKLGEGGMGVVYRAEDLTLGRIVALKFLPPDSIAREEDRARLTHEARAAAALLHPNICPIHEIAEAEGRTFIAMACIEGRSLKDRIAEGPLALDEALSIARQIGDALALAHAKGIIHRDIKPANIMLTAEGRPMLMDFGLAKVSGATKLTRTGTTVGTVAYMSPEQARGEEVDRRSDIWSLGAVLYEMLAGQMPFQGDYDQAVIYRILHEEPASISRLRPEVFAATVSVIEGALRKDPRVRYSSMREFLSDLESGGEGGGSRKRGATRLGKGFLEVRRRAVALLLIVAVVVTGSWLLLKKPGSVRSEDLALAVMDFENLGGSLDTLSAAGLSGLLQVGLIEKSPIRVISPEYLQDLRRRLFSGSQGIIRSDQALAVARKAGASFMLSGQTGREQGSTFAIWRLVETKRGSGLGGRRIVNTDLVALADGIIVEVTTLVGERTRLASPRDDKSVGQITSASPEALRRFTAAEVMFKERKTDEGLRQLEAAVKLDSTFALAWSLMADVYWSIGQQNQGRNITEKAWALRSRLGLRDRMVLESLRLMIDGQMTEGFDIYREMILRWPDDLTTLQSYSSALLNDQLYSEAQTVAEQGIARFPDDIELAYLHAVALCHQGKALEALASALEYQRRHPEEAFAWDGVAEAYLSLGKVDSAAVAFRRVRSNVPGDPHLQRDLARCAFLRGDPIAAAAILEPLVGRTDLHPAWRLMALYGHPWAITGPGLTNCYAEIGRLRRALELIREWERGVGSNNPEYQVQSQLWCGYLLLDWGRPDLVFAIADEMDKKQDVSYARPWALMLRTDALAEVDSLQAARRGLSQLRAMKDAGGIFRHYLPNAIWARISLREGRPDSALAYLEGLKRAMMPREYDTRVRALRALKRLPEAAATLEELLRLNGSRFIARYQLGQIYEEMGRKADATREYEIFLKAWENADPGWPQVEDARKRFVALQSATPK